MIKCVAENVTVISNQNISTSIVSSSLRTIAEAATWKKADGNAVTTKPKASHIRLRKVSIQTSEGDSGQPATLAVFLRNRMTSSGSPTGEYSDTLLHTFLGADAEAAQELTSDVDPIFIGDGLLYIKADGTYINTQAGFSVVCEFEGETDA